jgi:hypothetical protein
MKKSISFIADDGTVFTDSQKCLEYENTLGGVILKLGEKIGVTSDLNSGEVNYCTVQHDDIWIENGAWNLSHFADKDMYVVVRNMLSYGWEEGSRNARTDQVLGVGELIPRKYYSGNGVSNFATSEMREHDAQFDSWLDDDCPF